MLRQVLFLGAGVFSLLGALGTPGHLHAQHSRASPHQGFNPGSRRGVMPGMGMDPRFRRGVMPGMRMDPRFRGGFFDPRFGRGRFDRFEDRFENRFGFGRFGRLEDRLENRFRIDSPFLRTNGGFFDPRVSMGVMSGTPASSPYGGASGGGGSYNSSGPSSSGGGGGSGGYPGGSSSPYDSPYAQSGMGGASPYGVQTAKTSSMDLLDAMGVPQADGRLSWPLGLRILPPAPKATALRNQIDALLGMAARQSAEGRVSPNLFREAGNAVNELHGLLRTRKDAIAASSTYNEADRFLDKLVKGLELLR
jgi:hypothetical protein